VYFPTRIANNSITLLDNIFVNNRRKYTIQPCINGLSDHDAQLITLHNFSLPINNIKPSYIRNINKNTIAEFQFQLSWGQWDNILENNDVNNMFNNFLNTYLRCFYSSFGKKVINNNHTHNPWITKVVKISLKKRRNF